MGILLPDGVRGPDDAVSGGAEIVIRGTQLGPVPIVELHGVLVHYAVVDRGERDRLGNLAGGGDRGTPSVECVRELRRRVPCGILGDLDVRIAGARLVPRSGYDLRIPVHERDAVSLHIRLVVGRRIRSICRHSDGRGGPSGELVVHAPGRFSDRIWRGDDRGICLDVVEALPQHGAVPVGEPDRVLFGYLLEGCVVRRIPCHCGEVRYGLPVRAVDGVRPSDELERVLDGLLPGLSGAVVGRLAAVTDFLVPLHQRQSVPCHPCHGVGVEYLVVLGGVGDVLGGIGYRGFPSGEHVGVLCRGLPGRHRGLGRDVRSGCARYVVDGIERGTVVVDEADGHDVDVLPCGDERHVPRHGVFGSRLVERLAGDPPYELQVALVLVYAVGDGEGGPQQLTVCGDRVCTESGFHPDVRIVQFEWGALIQRIGEVGPPDVSEIRSLGTVGLHPSDILPPLVERLAFGQEVGEQLVGVVQGPDVLVDEALEVLADVVHGVRGSDIEAYVVFDIQMFGDIRGDVSAVRTVDVLVDEPFEAQSLLLYRTVEAHVLRVFGVHRREVFAPDPSDTVTEDHQLAAAVLQVRVFREVVPELKAVLDVYERFARRGVGLLGQRIQLLVQAFLGYLYVILVVILRLDRELDDEGLGRMHDQEIGHPVEHVVHALVVPVGLHGVERASDLVLAVAGPEVFPVVLEIVHGPVRPGEETPFRGHQPVPYAGAAGRNEVHVVDTYVEQPHTGVELLVDVQVLGLRHVVHVHEIPDGCRETRLRLLHARVVGPRDVDLADPPLPGDPGHPVLVAQGIVIVDLAGPVDEVGSVGRTSGGSRAERRLAVLQRDQESLGGIEEHGRVPVAVVFAVSVREASGLFVQRHVYARGLLQGTGDVDAAGLQIDPVAFDGLVVPHDGAAFDVDIVGILIHHDSATDAVGGVVLDRASPQVEVPVVRVMDGASVLAGVVVSEHHAAVDVDRRPVLYADGPSVHAGTVVADIHRTHQFDDAFGVECPAVLVRYVVMEHRAVPDDDLALVGVDRAAAVMGVVVHEDGLAAGDLQASIGDADGPSVLPGIVPCEDAIDDVEHLIVRFHEDGAAVSVMAHAIDESAVLYGTGVPVVDVERPSVAGAVIVRHLVPEEHDIVEVHCATVVVIAEDGTSVVLAGVADHITAGHLQVAVVVDRSAPLGGPVADDDPALEYQLGTVMDVDRTSVLGITAGDRPCAYRVLDGHGGVRPYHEHLPVLMVVVQLSVYGVSVQIQDYVPGDGYAVPAFGIYAVGQCDLGPVGRAAVIGKTLELIPGADERHACLG